MSRSDDTPMILQFGQWQGSCHCRKLQDGAAILVKRYFSTYDTYELPLVECAETTESEGICNLLEISHQLAGAHDFLDKSGAEKIFLIGGDCGAEVPVVTYLNMRHKGNMSVVWLDAHADLNTPDSSLTGAFHGMPLRAIVGECNQKILDSAFSFLDVSQITLAGVRELDDAERVFISENRIPTVGCRVLDSHEFKFFAKNVYIHIDLDVIDPNEFSDVCVLSDRGISIEGLCAAVSHIASFSTVVGISIMEYMPKNEASAELLSSLIDTCKKAIGV